VIHQYPEKYASAISKLDAAGKEFNALGVGAELPVLQSTDTATRTYEDDIRRLEKAEGVEFAPIPAPSHERLLKLAVEKLKPFKKGGKGYADALIWSTVVEYAVRGDVAFVTDNHHDFADDSDHKKPAPELAEDLVAAFVLPEVVQLYPSLKSFIDEHIPPDAQLTAEMVSLLRDDADFASSMNQLAETLLADQALDDIHDLQLGVDREAPRIRWFDVSRVEIEEARAVDDSITLDLLVEGDADVEFFIPKWEAYATEGISIIEPDWNETYAWAEATRRLLARLAVTLDAESKEWLDYDLDSIEVSDGS
jgi:hypothetical protein